MQKSRIVIPAVAAVLGIGLGAAVTGSPASEPEPSPTVTVEAEPVVQEVEVATVPQVCLDALAEAEVIFGVSAEFADITTQVMYLSADAVEAAAAWDSATLDTLTVQLNGQTDRIVDLTNQITASDYGALAAECRAAG